MMKLQNLFRWLIDDVLGKWNSLLVRMKLWERVRRQIWEAPLFGHGIVDGTARELKNGFNWAMHAHNLLLEILYQGGVVNLVLWVMIIVLGGGSSIGIETPSKAKLSLWDFWVGVSLHWLNRSPLLS